jgi:predicted dithiol-disulfide oxidoreductase (DUF899 family)
MSTTPDRKTLHDVRFPNETPAYRSARDALLIAERELRDQVERVAAMRRSLPLGGEVTTDYRFDEIRPSGDVRTVGLDELFGEQDELLLYNMMFGPKVKRPCPMCTSVVDALDGSARAISSRAALVVVAKTPIDRLSSFAKAHGWRRVRLLSSARNEFNADYHAEGRDGAQNPVMHVFARRDGRVFHSWSSELLWAPQGERHVDMIWPLWNLLDLTPRGRGADWFPDLETGSLTLEGVLEIVRGER